MQRFYGLTALAVAWLPLMAVAQPVAGPYISLGAGVDFLQNEIEKPDGFGPGKRAFTFDPGATGNLAVGYGFGNGLRLEVEGNYGSNNVSGVKFPSGQPGHAAGSEKPFGGFANLLYDFNLGLPITPYLGVGAGYQQVALDQVSSGGSGFQPHGTGTASEGAFAYQGVTGLSYRIGGLPGLSLTAEYRMVGVLTPPPYSRNVVTGVSADGTEFVAPGHAAVNNIFNHEALIGLRYDFGAPPPPTPAPAPQATTAAPVPQTRTYLVFFDWDRADLSARARQIVAEAASAAQHVQTTRIDVNGYTDLSGSAAYNQRLSVRRAESVEAELVRDGVPKDEIVMRGFGEANPLVPTASGVREPQNRRVEIVLH